MVSALQAMAGRGHLWWSLKKKILPGKGTSEEAQSKVCTARHLVLQVDVIARLWLPILRHRPLSSLIRGVFTLEIKCANGCVLRFLAAKESRPFGPSEGWLTTFC